MDSEPNTYVDEPAMFEAHELRVVVHDGEERKVLLDGITFPLVQRSMMAVIGPAGSGKSTLLGALAGTRPATSGSVVYDHRNQRDAYDDVSRRIYLVPHESSVRGRQTVRKALSRAVRSRFRDVSAQEREQRVAEVLDEMSMTGHMDKRLDDLLQGEKKRAEIALAVLARPALLLLDAPTAPLDAHLKRDVFAQLRNMARPSAEHAPTVVVVTTDVEPKLLDPCDRLLVLQPGGTMAYFGPPADGLRYFGQDDWANVFQRFADEPDRDFAAEYRASPEYVSYVATPMSDRSQSSGGPEPTRRELVGPKPRQRGGTWRALLRRHASATSRGSL